jgi:hypothetical protein
VPDREAAIARFPRRVRDRLAAFAEAVDGVPNNDLAMFATRPLDSAAHDAARATADRLAAERAWQDGMAALRALAINWIQERIDDPTAWAGIAGRRGDGLSTQVDDLRRVTQSLADAFRAVALWDELDEADRDELLGPWGSLAEST